MKSIFFVILLNTTSIAISQVPLTNDASFPGGYEKLSEFINDELKWDEIDKWAEINKIQVNTTLQVMFVVDKNGSLSRIGVQSISAPCPPCEAAALDVVRHMPNWEPARKNGKPVSFWVRLPFVFNTAAEN